MKVKTQASVDDLMRMPDDGYKYELVDGAIIASPTGVYHSVVSASISHLLKNYLEQHPIGIVMSADVGIRLPDGNVRSPDVSFVRTEKLPGGQPPLTFGDFVPDLAVEVLSPSDNPREIADKIGEYLECGVPLVWLVDPHVKCLTMFRSLTEVKKFQPTDTVTAEPVLPGFTCLVSRFF